MLKPHHRACRRSFAATREMLRLIIWMSPSFAIAWAAIIEVEMITDGFYFHVKGTPTTARPGHSIVSNNTKILVSHEKYFEALHTLQIS